MTTGKRSSQSFFRIGLVLMLVGLMVAAPIAGAAPADDVSFDGDNAAPNPQFDVDTLTVARHPVSQGLDDGSMAGYYDDGGDWVSDPVFEVNTTADVSTGDNVNPYTFNPAHVDTDSYEMFPRDADGASALDASEWSKSGANSGGLTISDTEVAEGVNSVRLDTGTSFAAGDTATATYSNWTSQLDSDESKRVLQIGGDVDTLESGATVYVNVTDESGDVKSFEINPSANQSDNDKTIVGQTGSFVYQKKLSDVSTTGGGDWSNIESIDIEIADGDADISLSWVDLEKKGVEQIAKQKYDDSDDNSDHEDVKTIYSTTGTVSTHSMETLGSLYGDDAVVNDVDFPAIFAAEHLDGEESATGDYQITEDSADQYPSFDGILNTTYRLKLPSQIDLSYSGVDLVVEQEWPEGRYVEVGHAEAVGDDKDFSDVSLTSFSNSLDTQGTEITIDSTVTVGDNHVVSMNVLMTQSELDAVKNVGGGAAAPADSGGSGGVVGFITSLPGMVLTVLTGFLSFRWLKNR